jgi:hypothetical protein
VLARRLELSGLPHHLHAGEHLYIASSLRHRGELRAAGAVRRGELSLRMQPSAPPSDIEQTALRLKLGTRSATPMINGVATSTEMSWSAIAASFLISSDRAAGDDAFYKR